MPVLPGCIAGLQKWLPQSKRGNAAKPPKAEAQLSEFQQMVQELVQAAEGRSADDVRTLRALYMSTGLEMKQRGNASFKKGDFVAAAEQYELGLDGLRKLESVPTDVHPFFQQQEEDFHEESGARSSRSVDALTRARMQLQVTLLSNRAEAFLRLQRFSDAASSARAALDLEPNNPKAGRRLQRALNPDAGPTTRRTTPKDYKNTPTWKLILLSIRRSFDLSSLKMGRGGIKEWLQSNPQLMMGFLIAVLMIYKAASMRSGRIVGNVRK